MCYVHLCLVKEKKKEAIEGNQEIVTASLKLAVWPVLSQSHNTSHMVGAAREHDSPSESSSGTARITTH